VAGFQLSFALAYLRSFALSENIHIHQPFGLHRQSPALNRHFKEIAFLKLQSIEYRLRDYDLAALPDTADGRRLR
jgi:hypothetical protein